MRGHMVFLVKSNTHSLQMFRPSLISISIESAKKNYHSVHVKLYCCTKKLPHFRFLSIDTCFARPGHPFRLRVFLRTGVSDFE